MSTEDKEKKTNLIQGPGGGQDGWRNAARSESPLKGRFPKPLADREEHKAKETFPDVDPLHDPERDDYVAALRRPKIDRTPYPTFSTLQHPELETLLRDFSYMIEKPVEMMAERAANSELPPDKDHYISKVLLGAEIVRDVYASYGNGWMLKVDMAEASQEGALVQRTVAEKARKTLKEQLGELDDIDLLRERIRDALDPLFAYMDALAHGRADEVEMRATVEQFSNAWKSPEVLSEKLYIDKPLSELYANYLSEKINRSHSR
jgi:hypothetical protein